MAMIAIIGGSPRLLRLFMLLRPNRGVRRTIVSEVTAALRATVPASRHDVDRKSRKRPKTYLLRQMEHEVDIESIGDELRRRRPYSLIAEQIGVDLPTPVSPQADRILLERELCAEEPVLLAIDDVHHADAATLELLNVLAGAARNLQLALLFASRTIPARHQLVKLTASPDVRSWTPPRWTRRMWRCSSTADTVLGQTLSCSGGWPPPEEIHCTPLP